MSNIFDSIIETPPAKKPAAKKTVKKKPAAKKPVEKKQKPEKVEKSEKKEKTNPMEILESIDFNPDPSDIDLAGLIEESQKAKLLEPILKNEALSFKNEKAKVELQKQAGELIEYSMAEFLFIGYMEKCNADLLSFMKRIRPKIINLVKENDQKGVERLVMKEIKAILISIKKQQKEDLIKWKKDR